MDSTRTLARSAARFFTGTALSRVTGLVRDVLMAAAFGSHPSVAALLMAFRFANLPRRLLAEGAMQSALIPRFEAIRTDDAARGAKLICDLAMTLLLFLGIGITLAKMGLRFWQSTLSPEAAEVIQLTSRILPAILFIALFGVCSSVLQCQNRFFVSGVAPMVFNLVWILGILLVWHYPCARAVGLLAHAVVIAFAVQWLVTVPQTLASLRALGGPSFWRGARPATADVASVLRRVSLGILGVGAQQLVCCLDSIFARLADPSGPAYLWYALRLQQLPLGLFGLALSGAVLPPLARAMKAGQIDRYNSLLTFALEKGGMIMVASTFAAWALGTSAVNLIFGRGAFSSAAVWDTAICLGAYAAGLLPMTWIFLLAGACYAHEEYRLPALISAITVACNIALDALLVMVLHLSAHSVAIATAFSAWLQVSLLIFYVHRKQWGVPGAPIMKALMRSALAASVAYLAVQGIKIVQGPLLTRHFTLQLWTFTTQAALFASAWVATAFLTGERFKSLAGVREKVADHRNFDGQ
jgi:putative peptidoglycan lipid II flippase